MGIIAIIIGLLIFRFSFTIFVVWLNWAEGAAWSWLFGLIFIFIGLFSIVAWWRNNVSMFTSRHSVNWRSR